MKKLFAGASVEKIILITPITNSSTNIEKVTLSNYCQIVLEKDLFKVGDLCVFCKENTELPDLPKFKSLAPDNFVVRKKTIAGHLSEGVCFPLSILPKNLKVEIGMDISESLGATDLYLSSQKKAFARKLLEEIKKAFSNTTLGNGISLREARAIDDDWVDRSEKARKLDEQSDWQKVTDQDLENYSTSFHSFSDQEGKRYYLPAYMSLGLRKFIPNERNPSMHWWNDLTELEPIFGVSTNFDALFNRLLQKNTFLGLTTKQTRVVKLYLAFFNKEIFEDSPASKKIFELINKCTNKKSSEKCTNEKSSKKCTQRKLKFANKPSTLRHR